VRASTYGLVCLTLGTTSMAGLYVLAVTLRPSLHTFLAAGAASALLCGLLLTVLAGRVRR
jgi:hypothetical protein